MQCSSVRSVPQTCSVVFKVAEQNSRYKVSSDSRLLISAVLNTSPALKVARDFVGHASDGSIVF